MYYVAKYDYTLNDYKIVYYGSERNCLGVIESDMFNSVSYYNGKDCEINTYDDYVFEWNQQPDLSRVYEQPSYYITKSKNCINKWKIRSKKKKYGVLYNTYTIKNIASYKYYKFEDFKYIEYRDRKDEFDAWDEYGNLLRQLCS